MRSEGLAMSVEQRWTCEHRQCLLGIERGGRLHIKTGQLHYIVEAPSFRVTAVCRRCGSVSALDRDGQTRHEGASSTTETPDVQQANEAHRRPARKAERSDRHLES